MLSAKDQNTPLQERAVEENVVAQKKIQSGRPRARRGRCKKKQEAQSSTPQVGRVSLSVTLKSFKFIGANFLWMVGYFAYPWGYNFVDAWVFSLSRKNLCFRQGCKFLGEGLLTNTTKIEPP